MLMLEVVKLYNGKDSFGTILRATMREIKLCGGSISSSSDIAELEEAVRQKYLTKLFLIVELRRQYGELVNNLRNDFTKG